MRCMECDRPSLNPLEFLWKNFLPLVTFAITEGGAKCAAKDMMKITMTRWRVTLDGRMNVLMGNEAEKVSN